MKDTGNSESLSLFFRIFFSGLFGKAHDFHSLSIEIKKVRSFYKTSGSGVCVFILKLTIRLIKFDSSMIIYSQLACVYKSFIIFKKNMLSDHKYF